MRSMTPSAVVSNSLPAFPNAHGLSLRKGVDSVTVGRTSTRTLVVLGFTTGLLASSKSVTYTLTSHFSTTTL